MAQIQPTTPAGAGEGAGPGADLVLRRPTRKAVRYGVPVAVAGVTAVTIGLVPALADSGSPDLPKITAEELVAKMATSDVDQLSGTVRVSADLGLPSLPDGLGGGRGGLFGGGSADERGAQGDGGEQSPAAPGAMLRELASGEHTLRVAADGPDKQRVSVIEDAAEYSFVRNGNEVWTYDSTSHSAFHGIGPEDAGKHAGDHGGKHGEGHGLPDGPADLTPKKAAEKALELADETTSVTVDGTAKVAGRDAYQLVIAPKAAARSTVGSLRIAVDAENGAPLKFTLTADEGGKPIVDIGWTEVDFAKPEAGTFSFDPPKGADVTEKRFDGSERPERQPEKLLPKHPKLPETHKNQGMPGFTGGGLEVLGEGWGSVAVLEAPEGAKGPAGGKGTDGSADSRAQRLLDGLTDKVNGEFGTGRVFETRLFNILITDDGTVYAGAVTKEGLVKAANAAK